MPTTKETIKTSLKYNDENDTFMYQENEQIMEETTFNWSRLNRLLNELKEQGKINFHLTYRKKRENEVKGLNVYIIQGQNEGYEIYVGKQSLPKTLEQKFNFILNLLSMKNSKQIKKQNEEIKNLKTKVFEEHFKIIENTVEKNFENAKKEIEYIMKKYYKLVDICSNRKGTYLTIEEYENLKFIQEMYKKNIEKLNGEDIFEDIEVENENVLISNYEE